MSGYKPVDLFAGMSMQGPSQSMPQEPKPKPQEPSAQASQQPTQQSSSMPGLFAGMSLGGTSTTSASQAIPQQQPPSSKPPGSAFGIQLGAFSGPPIDSAPPAQAPSTNTGTNSLGLFSGLTKPDISNPSVTSNPSANPNPSAATIPNPNQNNQQPNPIASFLSGGATAANQPVPEHTSDPFESQFGIQKGPSKITQNMYVTPKTTQKEKPAQNDSFEEIQKDDVANTPTNSAGNNSSTNNQDFTSSGQFRINGQVVNSLPPPNNRDSVLSQQSAGKKPPQKQGFFKSAFNFVTGGILSGPAAQKQAYAPQITTSSTTQDQAKKQHPVMATKQIGGVTITSGAQGTGISIASKGPEEAHQPNDDKSQTIQAERKLEIPNYGASVEETSQPNLMNEKIPEPQISSFNFMSTSKPAAADPIAQTYEKPVPEPAPDSNPLGAFFAQNSTPIQAPVQPVQEQNSTLTGTNSAFFDFMSKSMSSPALSNQTMVNQQQQQDQNTQQTNIWGPEGMQQVSVSDSPFQPAPISHQQIHTICSPAPLEQAGSSNDLFNMLNSNISQTTQNNTTAAPPIIGGLGSVFGFMQTNNTNQSASLSSMDAFASTAVTSGALTRPQQQIQSERDIDIEEFEQLSESREIIEDRIFRHKLQIIELTITQQDLSGQLDTLAADIKILETQKNDATEKEASAAEREDYDEAEKLKLKIQSIKQLILAKQNQRKKLDEDTTSLESRKSDKYTELQQIVQKGKSRLNEIRTTQQAEMNTYEETEQLAVDEKKKRLHYERIRITEDTEEMRQQSQQVEKMDQEIDEQVYEDTKDQHIEKHRLDNEIEDLDSEISALEQQLTSKRKAREALMLEKGVYEKQIDLARSKYQNKINKQHNLKDKLVRKEEKLDQDNEEYKRDTEQLEQYEEHFKSKLKQFEKELEDIEQLEIFLNCQSDKIAITLQEKKNCLESQFSLKQERHSISIKLQNQMDSMDHRKEQIAFTETQIEDARNQLQSIEQRKLKVEAEKKKHAAQRKFREASTCQNQLKQLQTEQETQEKTRQDLLARKQALDGEASAKNEELQVLEKKIADLTKQVEQEQQKYLIYRIYDCNDMIKVLRPFCHDGGSASSSQLSSLMVNAIAPKDAKLKRHNLEQELIKMQKELLELELKYGSLQVDLPNEDETISKRAGEKAAQVAANEDDQKNKADGADECDTANADDDKTNEDQKKGKMKKDPEQNFICPATSPEQSKDKSALEDSTAEVLDKGANEAEQPEAPAQESKLSYEEVRAKIAELSALLSTLEEQIEKACEEEDFDQAEYLQQQVEASEIMKAKYENELRTLNVVTAKPSEDEAEPEANPSLSEPAIEKELELEVPQVPVYGQTEEPEVPSYGQPDEPQIPDYGQQPEEPSQATEPQIPSYDEPNEEPKPLEVSEDQPEEAKEEPEPVNTPSVGFASMLGIQAPLASVPAEPEETKLQQQSPLEEPINESAPSAFSFVGSQASAQPAVDQEIPTTGDAASEAQEEESTTDAHDKNESTMAVNEDQPAAQAESSTGLSMFSGLAISNQ